MLNGFYAKTYEEELPNKNMFVSFMVDQVDINNWLSALGIDNLNNTQRELLIEMRLRMVEMTTERADLERSGIHRYDHIRLVSRRIDFRT